MRLLLDTNIVLWSALENPRLSRRARELIDGADAVLVSAVSIWEIAIKLARRKLDVDLGVLRRDIAKEAEELAVTWRHGAAVRDLPFHHADPFDRLLVAQAGVESLNLVTGDRLLARYGDFVEVV